MHPLMDHAPAILSYITIFNCTKSVPNFCPNSLEVQ